MACEDGIVESLNGNMALVKTRRSEACDHCSAKEGCHTMGGGKEMEIEVENTLDARPGDLVCVSVLDSSFLYASFLVYMVPILGLIAGAVIGENHGAALGMSNNAASAILGLVGLAVTFALVRLVANRLALNVRFQPRMDSIKQRGAGGLPPEKCGQGGTGHDGDDTAGFKVTRDRLHPPGA
ncbi:MAG: SoxR reducing system RseC family protein [Desulfatibacillaceae bacterium]